MNYKKGGKEVKIPEQKKEVEPRSATSFRGKSYIAKGDSNSANSSSCLSLSSVISLA